jgi:hypothetical protein
MQIGDPIEARYKEWTERGSAIDQLVYCINSFREAALSNDQKFDHIEISEKQKVGQSDVLKIHYLQQLHAITRREISDLLNCCWAVRSVA